MPSASMYDAAPDTAARAVPPGSSSSTTAKYQRPVQWDKGIGQWVTDKTRLSVFEACLASVFVCARTRVQERAIA
jgi:hypothetical protein